MPKALKCPVCEKKIKIKNCSSTTHLFPLQVSLLQEQLRQLREEKENAESVYSNMYSGKYKPLKEQAAEMSQQLAKARAGVESGMRAGIFVILARAQGTILTGGDRATVQS